MEILEVKSRFRQMPYSLYATKRDNNQIMPYQIYATGSLMFRIFFKYSYMLHLSISSMFHQLTIAIMTFTENVASNDMTTTTHCRRLQ